MTDRDVIDTHEKEALRLRDRAREVRRGGPPQLYCMRASGVAVQDDAEIVIAYSQRTDTGDDFAVAASLPMGPWMLSSGVQGLVRTHFGGASTNARLHDLGRSARRQHSRRGQLGLVRLS
jgi:hypothetical protein